jgi:hypothetical protein
MRGDAVIYGRRLGVEALGDVGCFAKSPDAIVMIRS